MTHPAILEETSRAIVEAQLLLDSDPKAAADHLLKAWGFAMRLAYPPRDLRLVERALAGEG
jgi:hypothetical protein